MLTILTILNIYDCVTAQEEKRKWIFQFLFPTTDRQPLSVLPTGWGKSLFPTGTGVAALRPVGNLAEEDK